MSLRIVKRRMPMIINGKYLFQDSSSPPVALDCTVQEVGARYDGFEGLANAFRASIHSHIHSVDPILRLKGIKNGSEEEIKLRASVHDKPMNFQGDWEVPAAQRPTVEGKDREMFAKDLAQSMIGVDSGNDYRFAQDKTEVDGNSMRSHDFCQSFVIGA
ncbi:hypothetical protein LQV05_001505 [Cryptococcus neoformans]|nr:hypothetical protein LQV05_001505 [Cryptococcus neoformans]